jgi:tetratricopeptide (TPR) repeat protein
MRRSPAIIRLLGIFLLCLIAQVSWAESTGLPASSKDGVRMTPPHKSYSSNVSAKSSEFYNQGTIKLRQGLYAEAIPLFLAAVKESRGNVDAWDHLGICYRRTHQIDKAIEAYEISIQINPQNPVPYQNLGLIYSRIKKDAGKALPLYKKMIEMDPSDPEGFFGLANVYTRMNSHDEAIVNFLKAVELYKQRKSPFVADAYYNLGVNYASKNPPDDKQAADYFLKAKKAGFQLSPEIETFVSKVTGEKVR